MGCRSILAMTLCAAALVGCGGDGGSSGDSGNQGGGTDTFTVTANAGAGGSVSPASSTVNSGETATLTVTPDTGFNIDAVTGCGGSLSGNTYTTSAISADCAVTASFSTISSNPFVAFRLASSVLDTGISGLMVVQADGQNAATLNPTLPVGGEVLSFEWSPNGERIAYFADQNIDDVNELFSVLPDGTGFATLNSSLTPGGDVVDFQWSPDGSKIAYRASQDQFDAIELYIVDADGQNRVKVSTSLVSGGNVEAYEWSPDGTQIFYTADAATNDQFELFVNTNDGTSPQQVNAVLSSGDTVEAFRWSPQGALISYVVNISGTTDDALYVFNPASSTNTQLDNGISVAIDEAGYVWSDNDSFIAVARSSRPPAGENGEVFIITTDGTSVATGSLDTRHRASGIAFVPDTTSLLVVSDSGALVLGDSNTVYQFAADGSAANRVDLTGSNLSAGQVIDDFLFSPDSQYVALHGGWDSWFYDLDNGTATRFIDGSSSGDTIGFLEWSQDSTRLFYVETIGTTPTVLSPNGSGINELDNSGSIQKENVRWINNRLIYTTLIGGALGGTVESVDQFGGNRLILGELPSGSSGPGFQNIESYVVSSDNSLIVYDLQSAMLNNTGEALYSVNLDGTNNVLLSESLPSGTGIEDYAIQPLN